MFLDPFSIRASISTSKANAIASMAPIFEKEIASSNMYNECTAN